VSSVIDLNAAETKPSVFHATLAEDFESKIVPILTSPVTEIVVTTAKSAEAFEEMLARFMVVVDVVMPNAVKLGYSCGAVVGRFTEDSRKLFFLAGWDTIEVRRERCIFNHFSDKRFRTIWQLPSPTHSRKP